MKIAFTTKGTNWDSLMDPRFGRTEYLLVYNEDEDELIHYDNRSIENTAHGAGPKTAQKLFEMGAEVLITGNGPGDNAARVLANSGISIFTGAGQHTVTKALEAYKNNELEKF
jgi:predicted Fe-Mo cluster-binding NifX family protein